jgi:hypothetical protein
MAFIIPPGGFAGFNSMTPASRRALFPGGARTGSTGKRRRRKASKVARKARRTTRARKGGKRLKFGSPAWQKKYRVGKFAKKR